MTFPPPQLPYFYNEENEGLNTLICEKCLEQCLAPPQCYLIVPLLPLLLV